MEELGVVQLGSDFLDEIGPGVFVNRKPVVTHTIFTVSLRAKEDIKFDSYIQLGDADVYSSAAETLWPLVPTETWKMWNDYCTTKKHNNLNGYIVALEQCCVTFKYVPLWDHMKDHENVIGTTLMNMAEVEVYNDQVLLLAVTTLSVPTIEAFFRREIEYFSVVKQRLLVSAPAMMIIVEMNNVEADRMSELRKRITLKKEQDLDLHVCYTDDVKDTANFFHNLDWEKLQTILAENDGFNWGVVVVTGWREWLNEAKVANPKGNVRCVQESLERVENELLVGDKAGKRHLLQLVHGDCPTGLDRLAARIADSRGWPKSIAEPAKWDVHGKRAGPIRNSLMLQKYSPHYVLAYHLLLWISVLLHHFLYITHNAKIASRATRNGFCYRSSICSPLEKTRARQRLGFWSVDSADTS